MPSTKFFFLLLILLKVRNANTDILQAHQKTTKIFLPNTNKDIYSGKKNQIIGDEEPSLKSSDSFQEFLSNKL